MISDSRLVRSLLLNFYFRHSAIKSLTLTTDHFTNVAVIGVGTFGRNHARVYHQLAQQGEPVRLVGVVDKSLERADQIAREFGCRSFGVVHQDGAAWSGSGPRSQTPQISTPSSHATSGCAQTSAAWSGSTRCSFRPR